MLNIDELIIIYIILNYQINKRVIRIVSCYPIIHWIVFEFVIVGSFVISELVNTVKYLLLTRPANTSCHIYLSYMVHLSFPYHLSHTSRQCNIIIIIFIIITIILKREILFIHNSETLHINKETKVLKTLEDDTTSMLIVRINSSRLTQLVILRYLEYLRFKI